MIIQCALQEMDGDRVVSASMLTGEPLEVAEVVSRTTGIAVEDLMLDIIAGLAVNDGSSMVIGSGQVVKTT